MMDPMEISPWGREEAEREKAFISEAWLSNPMLEEEYVDSPKTENPTSIKDDTTSPELKPELESDLNGIDVFYLESLEMNDMELALYQHDAYQQSLNKHYNQVNEWNGTGDSTHSLMQEFESICYGALTPPCSPPTPSPPPPQSNYAVVQAPISSFNPPACETETVDLDGALAMVDEILRDTAEALVNPSPKSEPIVSEEHPPEVKEPGLLIIPDPIPSINHVNVSQVEEVLDVPEIKVELISPSHSPEGVQEVPAASPVSSCYFSPNSVASSFPESSRPDSPSSLSSDETSDPEWMPAHVTPKRQRAKPYSRSSVCSSSDTSEFSPRPSTSRGRRAPRRQLDVDDRKERKKEQNKNAATRYRMKKKAEAEEVATEERRLEEKNDKLREKAEGLAREVSCLKKLMRHVFKAKGILPEN